MLVLNATKQARDVRALLEDSLTVEGVRDITDAITVLTDASDEIERYANQYGPPVLQLGLSGTQLRELNKLWNSIEPALSLFASLSRGLTDGAQIVGITDLSSPLRDRLGSLVNVVRVANEFIGKRPLERVDHTDDLQFTLYDLMRRDPGILRFLRFATVALSEVDGIISAWEAFNVPNGNQPDAHSLVLRFPSNGQTISQCISWLMYLEAALIAAATSPEEVELARQATLERFESGSISFNLNAIPKDQLAKAVRYLVEFVSPGGGR